MTQITFISDTHSKHNQITKDLPGGDIIIHCGDISSQGYKYEIEEFCKWFDKLNYNNKIFIAGNHDFLFQEEADIAYQITKSYNINYLQDTFIIVNDIKIWGSPWTPKFGHWAFMLPANELKLAEKWNNIVPDIDILITHGPAYNNLDQVIGRYENLGCNLLKNRIQNINPKIHVCGHIHSGYGYKINNTHYINAAVLNDQNIYTQKPLTVEWNKESNEIKFK